MKRKYWLLIVSVIASTMVLSACTSGLPEVPDTDMPIKEEAPVLEPSVPPVETIVEAEAESSVEDFTLPPMEDPENVTYDRMELTLNAMTINLLHISKNFDLDSDGQVEEINLIARDLTAPVLWQIPMKNMNSSSME